MDSRLKKIKFSLPEGWKDISAENKNGPPAFIDGRLKEPGVLQISLAVYISGQKPDPDLDDLLGLSEKIGLKNKFGQIINKDAGECSYGKYGRVEFTDQNFPYISVWHLSNGKDFIFATFICSEKPTTSELNDVKNILLSIRRRRRFVF